MTSSYASNMEDRNHVIAGNNHTVTGNGNVNVPL
jgi:hypothetical protein